MSYEQQIEKKRIEIFSYEAARKLIAKLDVHKEKHPVGWEEQTTKTWAGRKMVDLFLMLRYSLEREGQYIKNIQAYWDALQTVAKEKSRFVELYLEQKERADRFEVELRDIK